MLMSKLSDTIEDKKRPLNKLLFLWGMTKFLYLLQNNKYVNLFSPTCGDIIYCQSLRISKIPV